MIQNILSVIDPTAIINTLGLLGVLFIVFAESGLFFGFFFPGDSLLFTAGFFASQGYLNFHILLCGTFIMAVLGDSFGYWFGEKIGPKIFTREDSIFFHKKHVQRAEDFYEKHGKKTIILARFIPIVRTFAPIVAGVGKMKYSNFITYNVIGGLLWSFCWILSGYLLGNILPNSDRYILFIVLIIIIISVVPIFYEVIRSSRKS